MDKDKYNLIAQVRKTQISKGPVATSRCQECWRMYLPELGCLFCTKYKSAIDKDKPSV